MIEWRVGLKPSSSSCCRAICMIDCASGVECDKLIISPPNPQRSDAPLSGVCGVSVGDRNGIVAGDVALNNLIVCCQMLKRQGIYNRFMVGNVALFGDEHYTPTYRNAYRN